MPRQQSSAHQLPPARCFKLPISLVSDRRIGVLPNAHEPRTTLCCLGLDTDNDSVFMNETMRDYCEKAGDRVHALPSLPQERSGLGGAGEWRRGPAHDRYRRFEGPEATAAPARLYAAMRPFVNFFQPSFKLAAKARDGAKVRKRHHPPATPCQRLLADARISEEVRGRVEEQRPTLNPVRLRQEIRAAQHQLIEIADTPTLGEAARPIAPTLEQFLSGPCASTQTGSCGHCSVA
jgi:hypothetical protein